MINKPKDIPTTIKGITALLDALNLSRYQKHASFHILKFRDHINEMPRTAYLRSENYFEFTVTRNHNTDIEVDNKNVSESDSSVFFLSPGQTIRVDAKELRHDSQGYMVLFTSDFLNSISSDFLMIQQFPYFSMHLSPAYSLPYVEDDVFIKYMEKMYLEFQNLDANNIEIIRSFLTIILYEAKRLLAANTLKSTINSRTEEITYQFENLLKRTEFKKQKLSYYASQLNISTIYLSECVKKVTGKPAKKMVTEYLIFEAKSLLTHTSNTVDQIAFQLGFDDVSNFVNFFKKNVVKTPNQFRSQRNS